ncbi:MAG: hypothetical protein AAFO73_02050 [Pseudomonadota bacterium]
MRKTLKTMKAMTTMKRTALAALCIASLGLAGCSGNTYGTGKTQQEMLLNDLNGMVSLGTNRKKKRINYTSRPKLVPPPSTDVLKTPVQKTASADPSFPVNPEEARRARVDLVDEADANGTSVSSLGLRNTATRRGTNMKNADWEGLDKDPRPGVLAAQDSKKAQQERLARFKQLTGKTGIGVAKRRYLTQPPAEYRTPATTAAAGNVGEPVKPPKKKNGFSRF